MNYKQSMQHRVLTLDPSGDLPKSSLYTLQPEPVSLERTQAAAVCHSNSYTHSSRDRLKNTGPLSMSPVQIKVHTAMSKVQCFRISHTTTH